MKTKEELSERAARQDASQERARARYLPVAPAPEPELLPEPVPEPLAWSE